MSIQLNPTIPELPSLTNVKPTDFVIVESNPNTPQSTTSRSKVSDLVGGAKITFLQAVASSTWVLNHNLGFYPNVILLNSNGTEFIGDIEHIDLNTLRVTFTRPKSGIAVVG